MRHWIQNIVCVLAICGAPLLIGPSIAHAEDVSVEAVVSANKISLKEGMQLTLTIHGGGTGGIDPVQLPKIEGFDANYVGPSTKISIMNGQYASEKSFNYNLFPNTTGHFQIPAIPVVVKGQTYQTQPIHIEVVDAPAGQTTESEQTLQDVKDRILILLSTPKASVYVGEKVPISIRLLVTQLPVRNVQFPSFDKDGFTMEEIEQPKQYNDVYKGVKYDVVDFQTYIYPTRSGELPFGPVNIVGKLLYKTQQSPGDSFFGNLFESYQERPLTVTSEGLKLNVLPLPTAGQPQNFSGAVGKLHFTMTAGPAEVKVGDPVTVRMNLTGSGNFKSIKMPVIASPLFKSYDPQIKDTPEGKVSEQIIIPTGTDSIEVPAVSFDFFNPETGQYQTIRQGPFPIKVTAVAENQEFKAVGFNALGQGQPAGQTVDYVRTYIIEPFKTVGGWFRTWVAWVIVVGILGMVGGWVAWQRWNARLASDSAFARRRGAYKNANQSILMAAKHLDAGRPKDFYHALSRTLSTYLSDRFNAPAGTMSAETALPLLQKHHIPQEFQSAVKEIYTACDHVLFAGGSGDGQRMVQDLDKLKTLLAGLEKTLK